MISSVDIEVVEEDLLPGPQCDLPVVDHECRRGVAEDGGQEVAHRIGGFARHCLETFWPVVLPDPYQPEPCAALHHELEQARQESETARNVCLREAVLALVDPDKAAGQAALADHRRRVQRLNHDESRLNSRAGDDLLDAIRQVRPSDVPDRRLAQVFGREVDALQVCPGNARECFVRTHEEFPLSLNGND